MSQASTSERGVREPRRVRIAAEHELRDSAALPVIVENRAIAVFRVDGRCYAIDNVCPHMGGPLSEGELRGHVVTCPWHRWTWDVRTGEHTRNPRLPRIATYAVVVENGEVFIELP
jgi:nitrite reductase/ring-hydroxylating ferredoxin subunit